MKKYTTFIFITCLLFCITSQLYAQEETDYWVMSTYARMNFNDTISKADISSKMVHGLPTASVNTSYNWANVKPSSILDTNGNLILASNGQVIYNASNQILRNSIGGLGQYQSSILLPDPIDKDNKFYLLFITTSRTLAYASIDMTQNSTTTPVAKGLVSANTQVFPTSGAYPYYLYNLTAVKNANSDDYWILMKIYDGSKFHIYVWSLSSAGINTTPQKYELPVADFAKMSSKSYYYIGNFKFSSDGSRFVIPAYGANGTLYGTFDPSTGVVSNFGYKALSANNYNLLNAEFSPSGDQVYFDTATAILLQCSWADILNGQVSSNSITNTLALRDLQVGKDGRIYSVSGQSLFVIQDPERGKDCTIRQVNAYLTYANNNVCTFPNFPTMHPYASSSSMTLSATGDCAINPANLSLAITNDSNYRCISVDWGDGKRNMYTDAATGSYTYTHKYAAGSYKITVTPYMDLSMTTPGTSFSSSSFTVNSCMLPVNHNVTLTVKDDYVAD